MATPDNARAQLAELARQVQAMISKLDDEGSGNEVEDWLRRQTQVSVQRLINAAIEGIRSMDSTVPEAVLAEVKAVLTERANMELAYR